MKGRAYTIYSIITTLLQEAALAGVVLWILPQFDISIPLWILIIVMVAFGIWGYISYRMCKKTLDKEIVTSSTAMIGKKGRATTSLNPEGIIRIHGQLWKARADSTMDEDEEVVIMGIKGLTLFVTRSENHNLSDGTNMHTD